MCRTTKHILWLYENNTYIILVFDTENLLSQVWQVVEGSLGCDGEYKDKSLSILHVQVSHCCELFLKQEAKWQ